MSKDNLVISEKFTSIQGEGRTIGVKAIFVRLSGCNILCQSESWVCDTIDVWRKGVKTPFTEVFTEQEIIQFRNGYHLVITGGEPLMHQQKVCEFLYYFKERHGFLPIIEVETNGTIVPASYLQDVVSYFNVSPKLKSSGADAKRYNEFALEVLNNLPSSIFKFVVEDRLDVKEIHDKYSQLHPSKIWLMPAGDSREKLDAIRQKVVDLCLSFSYNFSDRLHIVIWNQKTGV